MMTLFYYVLVTGSWIYFEGYSSLIGWLIVIFLWLLPVLLRSGAFGEIGESIGDCSGSFGDAGGCDSGGDCGGGDGGCGGD